MNIADFNQFRPEEAVRVLEQCCTSERWIEQLVSARPFSNREALLQKADDIWRQLKEEDYLEAFSGHPKIGDMQSLKEKYSSTKALAADEQSSLTAASESVLIDLMQKMRSTKRNLVLFLLSVQLGNQQWRCFLYSYPDFLTLEKKSLRTLVRNSVKFINSDWRSCFESYQHACSK